MSIKNNNIKNLIIIFASLFILLFFTKQAFYNLANLKDSKIQKQEKLNQIVNELNSLQKLEQELKSWEKKEEIKKFLQKPIREDIIEYLHNYAEDVSNSWNELFIHSISFWKEKKSELGFMEQDITLKVSVWNKNILNTLLTKLTSDKYEYKFFINSFSFPNDNRPWAYTVTIPLKLLYK